jgi:hypothetical protein
VVSRGAIGHVLGLEHRVLRQFAGLFVDQAL